METFEMRLGRIRKENNYTQETIANKLNVTAQAVSKWENDITSPDIDTLIKLADIFNITIDELVGRTSNAIATTKKDINKMILKIIVDSNENDKVRVNLPMGIVKILVESGSVTSVVNNKSLNDIDFKQIISLVEQGIIGEIVSVDSSEGDHVRIIVE
ncbi:MAG: helix-turn-helix domain-containing protein [Candidatus Caccosoma sp.]|nr:helix-turn-helix domain-containing protein [Candidatus Caccosoma sp.]